LKRREVIQHIGMGTAGLLMASHDQENPILHEKKALSRLGNINHSVCRWCYSDLKIEELADAAKDLQMQSVELLDPEEWDIVLSRGLNVGLSNGSKLGITKGFNDPQNHAQLKRDYLDLIRRASDKGIDQIICFSGNRNGIGEKEGMENCAKGLDKLVEHAAKKNITLVMELLNSKIDHKDYQCDHTPWGVGLVKKIDSPNFRLLYDIYHMQIMEGDVIRTIQDNQQYIAHYHTGGVPGRNEINDTQELFYPAIMKAILETGYKGFVAQEFIPTRDDKLASLKESIRICDV